MVDEWILQLTMGQGPFMKFGLGVQTCKSCLERAYEKTRREDGAELEYQRGWHRL